MQDNETNVHVEEQQQEETNIEATTAENMETTDTTDTEVVAENETEKLQLEVQQF
jgi:hypothetical protein